MAVRDDDVIQQLDTEQQAGFEESFRDLMVFVTGSYGSGRMIVSDNNGDCSSQDRSLKDFSGCNRSRIGGTDRDNRIGGHLMRRIQVQSHECSRLLSVRIDRTKFATSAGLVILNISWSQWR